MLENLSFPYTESLIFQQDGAAPHSALPVRHFQDDELEGALWPIQSPYLYALDFFVRPFNLVTIQCTCVNRQISVDGLCTNSKANHYK